MWLHQNSVLVQSNEQQMKFSLSGKFLPLKDCTIIIKMDITPYMWLHQNPILVKMFIY